MNLFSNVCFIIWGEGWKHEAADALRVSLRNVQYWANGRKEIPHGVWSELACIVRDEEHDARKRSAQLLAVSRAIDENSAHLSVENKGREGSSREMQ